MSQCPPAPGRRARGPQRPSVRLDGAASRAPRAQFEDPKDGVNTSEEIRGLAAVLARIRRNSATIDAKAEVPLPPAGEELFATDHIVEYPEVVEEDLRSEVVDIVRRSTPPRATSRAGSATRCSARRSTISSRRRRPGGRRRPASSTTACWPAATAARPGHHLARVEVADPAAAGAHPPGEDDGRRRLLPNSCAASSTPPSARTSRSPRSNRSG